MKKVYLACLPVLLLAFCGCAGQSNTETRFLLDTVCTLTADCDDALLDGAFEVCRQYEKLFSKTEDESDVSLINRLGECEVNDETAAVINRALYYCDLSGGRYDITMYPVSLLWDFENGIVPSRDEISEALQNVDYHSVEVKNNTVKTGGKQIDLGSVAKGYIADKVADHLKSEGVSEGIVNLGGNVVVFGREYSVGIKKPFGDENIAVLRLCDCSAVTSGIYERYIEKDGEIFHHVLDKSTGFGVKNELASVTVIGKSSTDCDALSTVLLLMGLDDGMKTVNTLDGYEAVFVTRDGETVLSDGITEKNNLLYIN